MWTISETVSFDKRARMWVRYDNTLVGAVNMGDLRAYVFPFYTPGGRLVIQESPVDHPHHQGLFVGAAVNGHDMWNAGSFGNPRCRQVPASGLCHVEADAASARFYLTLDWCTEDGQPQLREARRIAFSAAPYGHIVDIRSRFLAAYGAIRFGETKEAGIAMRIPPEWTTFNGGVMLDAAGHVGESGIWDTISDWMDVSGEGPRGYHAGIALMPHRDSLRAPWMVRDYGLHEYNPWRFAQITVPADGALELGARFIAHDGAGTVAEIAGWYQDCP